MLRHQEVIEKLTIEQKLALLADVSALGKEDLSSIGLQGARIATLEEVNDSTPDKKFPAYARLANSWNSELIASVVETLAMRAKRTGVALLETPKGNVKSTPYSSGVSEDPYMAGALAKTTIQAIARRGVKSCVPAPSLEENDAVYSDVKPNERAINEYFRLPFEIANVREVGIVKLEKTQIDDEYQAISDQWQQQIAEKYPVLVQCHTAKEALDAAFDNNKVSIGGSYARVQEAWEHYQTLHEAYEAGAISYNELENECKNGAAISPEILDEAIEKILDFTFECQNMKATTLTATELEKLLLKSAEESVVLLKNKNGVLPLGRGTNVALIGALASEKVGDKEQGVLQQARSLHNAGKIKLVGYAKGYENEQKSNETLIKEAVELAKRANVALVILGYDEKESLRAKRNHTTCLPANQMALIDALAKEKVKIITVVGGDVYPDMRFDGACAASLLADIHGSKSAEGLFNVLCGVVSPSGKLACTCYNDTENHLNELWNYKENNRNKVGVFYGYRHYDTSGITVKYPFGHGLSYSNFSYSEIWTTAEGLNVNVRNRGKMTASEVVQVYVGKKDSAIIRPKKELKAFFKVHLRPGEEKRITIKYKDLDLRVWDDNRHTYVCEKGQYQMHIGSSSKDISATRTFTYGTESLKKSDDRLSNYLQSVSNIKSGGYHLDPPEGKSIAKSMLKKGWFTVAILILCIDIIYGYLDFVGWLPKHWIIYVIVAAITIAPLSITVASFVKYKQQLEKERVSSMEVKKNQRAKLNVADLSDEIPFEELFEQEFSDVPKFAQIEEKTEETKVVVQQEEKNRIVETPFDKEQTLEKVAEEFAAFAYEKGVKLDKLSVNKLFSSFAASRLIILKNTDSDLMQKLLSALNEYFGVSSSVESYETLTGDLFSKKQESGIFELTEAGALLASMTDTESQIRMAAITDVKSDGVKDLVAPIIRYVDHPQRKVGFSIRKGLDEISCELLENVWFVFVMARDEAMVNIPKYVLDMATVLDIELQIGKVARIVEEKAEETEQETETTELFAVPVLEVATEQEEPQEEQEEQKTLGYWQFKKLVDYANRDKALEEGLWKRIDRLEDFVGGLGEYRIDNKQWLRMEKYAAAYLAMGGEADAALDCVVAQHLIYGIMPYVAAPKKPLEEKFTHTIENIFGEGHAPCTLKAVRETEIGV